MSSPDYIEAIRQNKGVYLVALDNSPRFFPNTEEILNNIIDETGTIYVLGDEVVQLDSELDKEFYDSGKGYVVFSLGNKTLRLDYNYSSWDDPTFPEDYLYYVERHVEKVVSEVITYSRSNQ